MSIGNMVPGTNGLYVTKEGDVWKTTGGMSKRRKALPDRDGYPRLSFARNGKMVRRGVHQLVLELFVGTRPDGMVSMHINGNPSDNRLENLRYGTQSENLKQAVSDGTWAPPTLTVSLQKIKLIRFKRWNGETFRQIGKDVGISGTHAWRIFHHEVSYKRNSLDKVGLLRAAM